MSSLSRLVLSQAFKLTLAEEEGDEDKVTLAILNIEWLLARMRPKNQLYGVFVDGSNNEDR